MLHNRQFDRITGRGLNLPDPLRLTWYVAVTYKTAYQATCLHLLGFVLYAHLSWARVK